MRTSIEGAIPLFGNDYKGWRSLFQPVNPDGTLFLAVPSGPGQWKCGGGGAPPDARERKSFNGMVLEQSF